MPSPHAVTTVSLAAAAVVVAWRVTARVRRSIGRQPLRLWRARLSAWLLPVALSLLLATALSHPLNALAQGTGVALGVAAALYSLRTTRFEAGPGGWFYTPNPYVGAAVVALFCARVAYRLIDAYQRTGGFATPPSELFKSPSTLLIVGLLLGYYATYAWGLLRWRARALPAGPAAAGDG